MYDTLHLSKSDYDFRRHVFDVATFLYLGNKCPVYNKARVDIILRKMSYRIGGQWELLEEDGTLYALATGIGSPDNDVCLGTFHDRRFAEWLKRDGIPKRIVSFDVTLE